MSQVEQELSNLGFSDAEVQGGGLKVTTTLDKKIQDAKPNFFMELSPVTIAAFLPFNFAKCSIAFSFGSGFGDDEADMTPMKAQKVVWEKGIGTLKDNLVLIPATSVKGALAHRVAYKTRSS